MAGFVTKQRDPAANETSRPADMCVMLQGRRFYGDLLPDGQIKYSRGQDPDSDRVFPSPTAFNNFCAKLADPSYQRGNGFIYVFHKPPSATSWMPLDFYRWKTFGKSEKKYPKDFKPADVLEKSAAKAGSGASGAVESLLPYGSTEDLQPAANVDFGGAGAGSFGGHEMETADKLQNYLPVCALSSANSPLQPAGAALVSVKQQKTDRQTQMDDVAESGSDPGIQWLGSERKMLVVSPGTCAEALAILERLDAVLRKRTTERQLYKLIDGGDKSVRRIQAERLELFVHAPSKGDAAFRRITREMPANTKEVLLAYAQAQANRDPRLKDARFRFGVFSIIINYSGVQAQAEHIDLLKPSFQFGLAISDRSSGTSFSDPPPTISTVDDLEREWIENCAGGSPHLFTLFRGLEDSSVNALIRDFGGVLRVAQRDLTLVPHVRRGSLFCLPGGVKHAGPKSDGYRAVMFFSGHPEGSACEPYDPDTQYTAATLCAHLVSLLWRHAEITEDDRRFLLRILARYIDVEKEHNATIWAHFEEGEFATCIEKLQALKGNKREKFIQAAAKKESTCPSCDPFSKAAISNWVACDSCEKWRRLSEGSPTQYQNIAFHCSFLPGVTCSTPEEPYTDAPAAAPGAVETSFNAAVACGDKRKRVEECRKPTSSSPANISTPPEQNSSYASWEIPDSSPEEDWCAGAHASTGEYNPLRLGESARRSSSGNARAGRCDDGSECGQCWQAVLPAGKWCVRGS